MQAFGRALRSVVPRGRSLPVQVTGDDAVSPLPRFMLQREDLMLAYMDRDRGPSRTNSGQTADDCVLVRDGPRPNPLGLT